MFSKKHSKKRLKFKISNKEDYISSMKSRFNQIDNIEEQRLNKDINCYSEEEINNEIEYLTSALLLANSICEEVKILSDDLAFEAKRMLSKDLGPNFIGRLSDYGKSRSAVIRTKKCYRNIQDFVDNESFLKYFDEFAKQLLVFKERTVVDRKATLSRVQVQMQLRQQSNDLLIKQNEIKLLIRHIEKRISKLKNKKKQSIMENKLDDIKLSVKSLLEKAKANVEG